MSERQLAANRRNAQRSTGPRSHAGKRRASRNAFRYGLTLSITSDAEYARKVEKMARKIAGDSKDEHILELARVFAAAELDIARVRRTKVALIERVRACGTLERPRIRSVADLKRFVEALDRGIFALPPSIDYAATMPPEEPQRSAEAIRRVLPELLKLERYEQRASTRRDEAARKILLAQETKTQL